MPERIKVLPVADDAVGIVHPDDGPLDAEGSLWTFDVFTSRRLMEGLIRREEKAAEIVARPTKATKAAAAEAPATP